jgi:hypothetical protein
VKGLIGITFIFFLSIHFVSKAESIEHRVGATNLQSNDWHLAESTEGGFSVQVPSPFVDATYIENSKIFSITSVSPNYTAYIALFVPSGTQPEMFSAFYEALKVPDAVVGSYQENTTIYEVDTFVEEGIKAKSHSKRINTDLGLYVLWVIVQVQNERPADIQFFLIL